MWAERSMEPRIKAIENLSFLGKAYSRLGIIKRDRNALMRSVIERSVALEMFTRFNRKNAMGGEQSFLADDFRALGKMSTGPELRHHFYLKAHKCSEEAIKLFPYYLTGCGRLPSQLLPKQFLHRVGLSPAFT